jgi:bacterioferritin (cytochrome b1)
MTYEQAALTGVLRLQMTAVNQQFMHILALRQWDENELAARITRVDNIDFPVAMRIADYLVAERVPLGLQGAEFAPGNDPASIVAAELCMERKLGQLLAEVRAHNAQATDLLRQAKAPRVEYIAWLEERAGENDGGEGARLPAADATAATVAHLLSLSEQAMLHAFVHRHRGDRDAADDAWSTSGAAMMHLTALVRNFAALRGIPHPGSCPSLDVRYEADEALAADLELAAACTREAKSAAARCDAARIAENCAAIATACEELARWDRTSAHPAERTNPAAFQSFDMTLDKFVR